MSFRERVGFGSGSGGFIVPVSASIPFADNAARDVWAAANLEDLIANQTIVEVTGTPNVWYLWTGPTNPATYDNTQWIDATPIIRGPSGADGTDGADGADGTDGTTGPEGPEGPEGPQGQRGPAGGTSPRIFNFTSTTLAASVEADTTLSGAQTFTFSLDDVGDVEGNLTLTQAGTTLATDIDPTTGITTQTIAGVTLAATETAVFTLAGVSTAETGSQAFSATFTVRARQQQEQAYSYAQAAITAGTQDLTAAGVGTHDVTALTGSYSVSVTVPDNEYLVIEYPANRPITAIEVVGIPADLATFPEQVAVRTIAGISYNARTNQNLSGQALPLDYVVRY